MRNTTTLAMILFASTVWGEAAKDNAEPTKASIVFELPLERVYLKDDQLVLRQTISTGPPQEYTVRVASRNSDGTVGFRNETRTRSISRTEDVPLTDRFVFGTIAGEKLSHEQVASRIDKYLFVLPVAKTKVPIKMWRQFLKPEMVLMYIRKERKSKPAAKSAG